MTASWKFGTFLPVRFLVIGVPGVLPAQGLVAVATTGRLAAATATLVRPGLRNTAVSYVVRRLRYRTMHAPSRPVTLGPRPDLFPQLAESEITFLFRICFLIAFVFACNWK
eukprot:Polyplicarium_translucidae@DN3095_c0_g1_i6.p2